MDNMVPNSPFFYVCYHWLYKRNCNIYSYNFLYWYQCQHYCLDATKRHILENCYAFTIVRCSLYYKFSIIVHGKLMETAQFLLFITWLFLISNETEYGNHLECRNALKYTLLSTAFTFKMFNSKHFSIPACLKQGSHNQQVIHDLISGGSWSDAWNHQNFQVAELSNLFNVKACL